MADLHLPKGTPVRFPLALNTGQPRQVHGRVRLIRGNWCVFGLRSNFVLFVESAVEERIWLLVVIKRQDLQITPF